MKRDIALIVDDHTDTCEMLELLLKQLGYRVETYESFDTALDRIQLDHLCVAFVDLHVPGTMKTEDFIQRARAVHPDLRIVLVSALPAVHTLAKKLGADSSLLKPFGLHEVVNEVEANCPKAG